MASIHLLEMEKTQYCVDIVIVFTINFRNISLEFGFDIMSDRVTLFFSSSRTGTSPHSRLG